MYTVTRSEFIMGVGIVLMAPVFLRWSTISLETFATLPSLVLDNN